MLLQLLFCTLLQKVFCRTFAFNNVSRKFNLNIFQIASKCCLKRSNDSVKHFSDDVDPLLGPVLSFLMPRAKRRKMLLLKLVNKHLTIFKSLKHSQTRQLILTLTFNRIFILFFNNIFIIFDNVNVAIFGLAHFALRLTSLHDMFILGVGSKLNIYFIDIFMQLYIICDVDVSLVFDK